MSNITIKGIEDLATMSREDIEELIENLRATLTNKRISEAFEKRDIKDGKLAKNLVEMIGASGEVIEQLLRERECLRTDAMDHLGEVLGYFANLHEDYRCRAFEDAVKFYNKHNSNSQIRRESGFNWYICQQDQIGFNCRRQLLKEREWRPIETAPHDGTEVLGYREDCGIIIIKWASAAEFMTDREIDDSGMSDEDLHELDWFCADFFCGCRLEGSEVPTHWMPLPSAPDAELGKGGEDR